MKLLEKRDATGESLVRRHGAEGRVVDKEKAEMDLCAQSDLKLLVSSVRAGVGLWL